MRDVTDQIEGPANPPDSRVHQFLTSLSQLLVTLIEMTYTRLELIFVDLQEWVESLVSLVLWGLVAIFAGGASLLLGALALIFAFWDTHRILVSLLVMGAFVLVTVGSVCMILVKLRAQRALFASTLNEFAKDRELLKARS
jgi:uncharacterized membrane protein YqjE